MNDLNEIKNKIAELEQRLADNNEIIEISNIVIKKRKHTRLFGQNIEKLTQYFQILN